MALLSTRVRKLTAFCSPRRALKLFYPGQLPEGGGPLDARDWVGPMYELDSKSSLEEPIEAVMQVGAAALMRRVATAVTNSFDRRVPPARVEVALFVGGVATDCKPLYCIADVIGGGWWGLGSLSSAQGKPVILCWVRLPCPVSTLTALPLLCNHPLPSVDLAITPVQRFLPPTRVESAYSPAWSTRSSSATTLYPRLAPS